jgi:poly(A) polymerase
MFNKIKTSISAIKSNRKPEISIKSLGDLKYFNGVKNIFLILKNHNKKTKLMLVGGCVRKLLSGEEIDDIDIAINLNPEEIKNILIENKIKFLETGISHGTITVIIDKLKFELTTLRKDTSTDGRHADVEFISDWEIDAKRRDFTINAIYSNLKGEIYDPLGGQKDLENKVVKFIGDPNERIREDYLRILRYFRFCTQYSNHQHDIEIVQAIKKGLNGVRKISKERILDEFYKILNLKNFYELFNDEFSCSVILVIFPQLKLYGRFRTIKNIPNKIINKLDIPLILSILLIDNTDNCEFFLYKFKFSNRDKNRILFLLNRYKKINIKELLDEQKLVKLAYLENTEKIIDLLVFSTFALEEIDVNILEKRIYFLENLKLPVFPITADYLKIKHNFSESKELGFALKKLEQSWIDNDFIIDKNDIKAILKLS